MSTLYLTRLCWVWGHRLLIIVVSRLILYFPVSSLVTLFGNILQNPLDPRAKSDTKLMNLVVNFLSMLGQEAETGGVHRMLGVCSEFERVARKVIEKAEKEQSTRRKRKGPDASAKSVPASTTTPSTAQSQTPRPTATPKAHNQPTPPSTADAGLSPRTMKSNMGSEPSPVPPQSAGWPQEFNIPDDLSFSDMPAFMPTDIQSPSMAGLQFQQPLLPQDLYSMPVSLDWEWAEMSGAAYPTVENGNFGDGGMSGIMGHGQNNG